MQESGRLVYIAISIITLSLVIGMTFFIMSAVTGASDSGLTKITTIEQQQAYEYMEGLVGNYMSGASVNSLIHEYFTIPCGFKIRRSDGSTQEAYYRLIYVDGYTYKLPLTTTEVPFSEELPLTKLFYVEPIYLQNNEIFGLYFTEQGS